jgi:predicted ATPase
LAIVQRAVVVAFYGRGNVAALLHAELHTDTLRGRTPATADALDALNSEAAAAFAIGFAAKLEAYHGRSIDRSFAEDVLSSRDTTIHRAVFGDEVDALSAAMELAEGRYGPASELRISLGPLAKDDRYEGDHRDYDHCRALCSIAGPGHVLLDGVFHERLTVPEALNLTLRPAGRLRLYDLRPAHEVFVAYAAKQEPLTTPGGLDGVPHNLPVIKEPFVGRVEARRDLRLFLMVHPIVSIVGGGGGGKTRLALQLAGELARDYSGGVWLIELASLSNADLIAETIAATLGIEETTAQPSLDMIAEWLGARRSLLVLDNCEHMLMACRELASSLVARCPQLRILVTSRRSFGADGEHVYELPALTISGEVDDEEGQSSEAAELFRLRVSDRQRMRNGVRQDITFDPAVLHQLCRLLEGNPLAIELATARVRRWTIEEIYDRVSERFDALGEDPNPPHPRQRSLRATFEWSFQLLSPAAQRLLKRMSVFRGGATTQDVLAVVTDEMLPEIQVEDALKELVSGHLVSQEQTDVKHARYQQLDTVRTFAAEKLLADDAKKTFLARHASFFREMLITRSPALNSREQVAVQQQFREEHDNIRAALDWHLAEGELEHGLRLGVALRRFWTTAGFLNEGKHYFGRLLSRAEGDDAIALDVRAEALYCLATIAKRQSDFAAADESLGHSLVLADAMGDLALRGKISNELGGIAWRRADIASAQKHYEVSLELLKEMEHEVGIVTVLNSLAITHLFTGEFDDAYDYLGQSLELAREIGNQRSEIDALNNMAIIRGVRGEYGKARSLLAEGMNALQFFQDIRRSALSMNNLGQIAFRQGRFDDARELCKTAIREEERIGDQSGIILSRITLGTIALALDDVQEAERQFRDCLSLVRRYDERSYEAEAQMGLGRVALARRDLEEAERRLRAAEAKARAMPHVHVLAHTDHALAQLAVMRGELAQARSHYSASLAHRHGRGNRRGIAESLEGFADLALRDGEATLAVRLYAAADGLRDSIGAPLSPSEAGRVEEQIEALRERLGPVTFDAAWSAGLQVAIDDLVDEITP